MARKQAQANSGKPLQTIPFDEQDRAVMLPLIHQISEGKKAEKILQDYVGAIQRRIGVSKDRRITILKDCSQMIVLPEDK